MNWKIGQKKIHTEAQKEKKDGKYQKQNKTKQSIGDLWDMINRPNMHTFEVLEEENRENGVEAIFEEINL